MPGAVDNQDELCERLRSLVQDCIAKHLYSSAVFYADKLVTLSGHAPADVFLLAQAYYVSQQYRRAAMLLRNHGLMDDLRFRYLAAKCLAEVKEWDECLSLLGDGELDDGMQLAGTSGDQQRGSDISLAAAVCLLRGRVYEALDNRGRATRWYRLALVADPYCEQAFSALIDNYMLTNAEELALVDGLQLGPQDGWLRLLYRCRCKKYCQQDVMQEQLQELERPALSASSTVTTHNPTQTPEAAAAAGSRATCGKARALEAAVGVASAAQSGAAAHAAGPGAVAGAEDMATDAQPEASTSGWGLGDNTDVMASRADWCYHEGRYDVCYQLTHAVLERDRYAVECLPSHLASALRLGKKNDLFLRGHKLVEEYPTRALSWFAVACYYMCTKQYEHARRYFAKATQLDRNSATSWVGLGHACAAQDESDQAMAAYRTAARLFPGLHIPVLGMGMEYQRMNNLHLAERMFIQAQRLCPADPLVAHELGVLAYRNQQYEPAAMWLRRALDLLPGRRLTAAWHPTVVNLGHAVRKQHQYSEAIELYEQALGLCPMQPGTYAALGYTHHLLGNTAAAIEHYHKALGLRPDDSFTAEMLTQALQQECMRSAQDVGIGIGAPMRM